jgi:hypothetical protein
VDGRRIRPDDFEDSLRDAESALESNLDFGTSDV